MAWYNESQRHSLARKGIKSGKKKDFLKGGLADAVPFSIFDSRQLQKGIKVEMEHTDNPAIAREIASDHLAENPHYYDYLEEMENKMKKESLAYSKIPIQVRSFKAGKRVLSKQIRLGKQGNIPAEIAEIMIPHGMPGIDYKK